jgi:hypothetical protein
MNTRWARQGGLSLASESGLGRAPGADRGRSLSRGSDWRLNLSIPNAVETSVGRICAGPAAPCSQGLGLGHWAASSGRSRARAGSVRRVSSQRDLSWIKDWRVIVFGVGCALAGFLIALLIFGDPWHLPPDWGDIPTWLAVIVASVGGWIALSHLRQQQEVIEADIERQRKRDDLLDGQLRELADRERSRQREQAEQVTLVGRKVILARRPIPVAKPHSPEVGPHVSLAGLASSGTTAGDRSAGSPADWC